MKGAVTAPKKEDDDGSEEGNGDGSGQGEEDGVEIGDMTAAK